MKLKTYDYTISVKMNPPNSSLEIWSTMIIKAISVNRDQALKVAQILYPDYTVLDVKFHL